MAMHWTQWQLEFCQRAVVLAARQWRESDTLTVIERQRISKSLATFQLGEQSEGRRLQRHAEQFAAVENLPALPAVTRYFIREEQHHAAQLRSFMQYHGMALKQREWTDSLFRVLRNLAGFELAVRVLITAEVIGFVYYRALRRATGSAWLKQICRDFCADETVHLRYEADLLRDLGTRQSRLGRKLRWWLHRALLELSARVVYVEHRAVLQAAGYDAARFRRSCRWVFRATLVQPRSGAQDASAKIASAVE
jgi:hypothetical protein